MPAYVFRQMHAHAAEADNQAARLERVNAEARSRGLLEPCGASSITQFRAMAAAWREAAALYAERGAARPPAPGAR